MKTLITTKSIFLLFFLSILGNTNAQDCNNNSLIIDQNFSQYNGQNREYTLNMVKNDFDNVAGRAGSLRGFGDE